MGMVGPLSLHRDTPRCLLLRAARVGERVQVGHRLLPDGAVVVVLHRALVLAGGVLEARDLHAAALWAVVLSDGVPQQGLGVIRAAGHIRSSSSSCCFESSVWCGALASRTRWSFGSRSS